MRMRRRVGRLVGRLGAGARAGVAGAARAVAYRRQEALLLALLAASVVLGFAIDAWHRGAPERLDRLEAEPPRLAPVARTARARPASALGAGPGDRALAPARAGPGPDPGREAEPTAERPIDLNRATAAQLTRLPGIGPRLAARIVARRDELGGRFAAVEELARVPGVGPRRAERLRALVAVEGLRGPARGIDEPAAAAPGRAETVSEPAGTAPAVGDPVAAASAVAGEPEAAGTGATETAPP
jgi:competence ComEA-like helix-hairpin-helix protein